MSMTEGSVEYYDVIAVGGGVAGCSTALSLIRRNPEASVLVLDNSDPAAFKVGTALPEDAQQVLSYLAPQFPMELLQDMSESDPILSRSTGNACSWSSPNLQENRASSDGSGIGWHLDRSHFDEILRDLVLGSSESQKRVVLSRGTFIAIENVDENCKWAVLVQDSDSQVQKVYTSKWVVDASGREACVAHKLGARTVKFDNLVAFCALFIQIPDAMRADPDHRSIIEASENGWWYTAQTPNHIRVVIYYTDESDPSTRYARTQSGFLKLLYRGTFHIARLLTKFQYAIVSDPSTKSTKPTKAPIYPTPAGSSHLTTCCNERNGEDENGARWCAVGDAALAFDPLASQGIVIAMKTGSFVGDAIARELLLVQDPVAKTTALDPTSAIPVVMAQMRYKCEKEKLECYRQVTRFQGDFWSRRR